MNRDVALARLRAGGPWDIVVIGGGATGLGCAVDAAARGHRTLLIEQHDFAKGTSSRSTKLVHGGVRYLKRGDISLVMEALHERGLLCRNAPHLVHHREFIVPTYSWWEGPFYGIGLKLYDRLAGELGLGPSQMISREKTLERIPTVEQNGLKGGVCYFDGQFDDARLAIHLARTVYDQGGVAINYFKAVRLLKHNDLCCGMVARDEETGNEYELRAKVVINATGVFCDSVRQLDEPESKPIIAASQGVHLMLPRKFLPGDSAIMVPQTSDGRVLFAVPWHNCVVLGTTDTPVNRITLDPAPMEQEIEFILSNAARYLASDPRRNDVLSMFAGLRPLVTVGNGANTATLSREHAILISDSGLLTITGGKWTTYRRMAEETVNQAEGIAGLTRRPCTTAELHIHGWRELSGLPHPWDVYGSDAKELETLTRTRPELGRPLHPRLACTETEVVWAAREEMARTVEDVLSRRTRALLLDARASMEAAPRVAELLAAELGRDTPWQKQNAQDYLKLARRHLLSE